MRRSGHRLFAELGSSFREAERLVEYPDAFVEPTLQEPRSSAILRSHPSCESPLEMHINERPPGGIAGYIRVQMTHAQSPSIVKPGKVSETARLT
jgi:hypothetical protein